MAAPPLPELQQQVLGNGGSAPGRRKQSVDIVRKMTDILAGNVRLFEKAGQLIHTLDAIPLITWQTLTIFGRYGRDDLAR